ncbi:MAG: magnesium transporter CorA family protein [Nitrosopumilus sp.]|nr:magnesium transporter CorA family protein [Nitrosopumilus sp.]
MHIPHHIQGLETIQNENLEWVHVEKPTREKMDIIAKRFPIHELNMEDCLSKNNLPKIDRYDDHIFIILHFPTTHKDKTSPSFSQFSIFVGKNYLITIHQGDLKPLSELFQSCKLDDTKNKREIMGRTSGYLLHSIVDVLVDDLLHISMKVIGNLDDVEDDVFDEKIANAKEVSTLRREITTLRRIVVPLKRIMSELTSRDVKRFSKSEMGEEYDYDEEEDLISYFDDVNDHVSKVLDALDESKETIEIYKDTDFMLSSEKTNKILSFLTILFTLSIPVTVLGTFYGMNIDIPGSVNTDNSIYNHLPLFLIIVISIALTIVMIWYFRKLGWLTK